MTNGDVTLQALYQEVKTALGADALSPAERRGRSVREAAFLFAHVFGFRPEELVIRGNGPADPEKAAQLRKLTALRLGGEPLQYLLGAWEFYGLDFAVGPGVLVPRPETELLVDLALRHLPKGGRLVDLCSGSGAVAIAAASQRPGGQCWAVELSPAAYAFLQQNVSHHAAVRVQPVLGDALAPAEWLGQLGATAVDVITCNPPYLTSAEMETLDVGVRHEPKEALAGGADGLHFYRHIPALYHPVLKSGGWLLLEIGWAQGAAVQALVAEAGYAQVTVHKDLSGLDRVVEGRKK